MENSKMGTKIFLLSRSKTTCWGFPGSPVVRNLPANAGDMGLVAWFGTKLPQALGQLISLCASTTEPALQSLSAATTEVSMPQSPRPTGGATSMGSPRIATRDEAQHSQKQKSKTRNNACQLYLNKSGKKRKYKQHQYKIPQVNIVRKIKKFGRSSEKQRSSLF